MERGAEPTYRRGIALMLMVVVMWSTSGLFVRLLPHVDPFAINALRCLIMAVVLGTVLLLRHGRRWPLAFRAVEPAAMAMLVGFFVLGTPLFIYALANTTVAKTACLSATSPLFAALFARVLVGERAPWPIWLAIGSALLGTVVIVGEDVAKGGGPNLGDLAALGVAVCFAGDTVAMRRWHRIDLLPAAVVCGLVAGSSNLALAGGLGGARIADTPWLVGMGVIGLALPFLLLLQVTRVVPAVTLVLISLGEVVCSSLLVWAVIGEVPSNRTFLGALLIVPAVAVAALVSARAAALARTGSVPSAGA